MMPTCKVVPYALSSHPQPWWGMASFCSACEVLEDVAREVSAPSRLWGLGTGEMYVMETLPGVLPGAGGGRYNEGAAVCARSPCQLDGSGRNARLAKASASNIKRQLETLAGDHMMLSFQLPRTTKRRLLGWLSVFIRECHAGESCLTDCPAKLSLLVPRQEQREHRHRDMCVLHCPCSREPSPAPEGILPAPMICPAHCDPIEGPGR